jgi:hypothetical protein
MDKKKFEKEGVDWRKVVKEIKRQTGKERTTNYLQGVWRGLLQSGKVKKMLDELLGVYHE